MSRLDDTLPVEICETSHFKRSLGLLPAVAVNMTQMCGIGPFITIPQIIAAMGGPQAIVGWVLGAGLAVADGLVWAELGAAMPCAGGTYLYLREAFQYRTGRLTPFLFIGGIAPDNVRQLVARTGCRQIHGSFRRRGATPQTTDPSAVAAVRKLLEF